MAANRADVQRFFCLFRQLVEMWRLKTLARAPIPREWNLDGEQQGEASEVREPGLV